MMEPQEAVCLGCQVIQIATTSTFFGSAFYVNIVETPARKSLKTASAMVDHFQATFPRAKNQQATLAALGTLSGLAGKCSVSGGRVCGMSVRSEVLLFRLVPGQH